MQQVIEQMSGPQLVDASSREANALWPNRARLAALLAQLSKVAPNNQATCYHTGRCWEVVGEGAKALTSYTRCAALGGGATAERALARVRAWHQGK